jgi:hypothetical protein
LKIAKWISAVSQLFCAVLFIGVAVAPQAQAKDKKDKPKKVYTDGDPYKFRVTGDWWFSNPTITIKGNSTQAPINFDKELGFDAYSTFNASADWHITRRQHILFNVSPSQQSKTHTLTDTIEFNGNTYEVGTTVKASADNLTFAPGYEFDLIRNDRGHLGIVGQINLMNISAKITGQATVTSPGTLPSATVRPLPLVITKPADTETVETTSSGSVFAPLPVFGPEGRYLFIKGTDKVYADGFIKGMYFFGYGNFISTRGTLGVQVWKKLNMYAGYQLGSRLAIHGTESRLDVRLTQNGPVVGAAYSW